jgi:hypothetical protein
MVRAFIIRPFGQMWLARFSMISVVIAIIVTLPAWGENAMDVEALFARAEQDGRVGVARKSKPVDARPATPGEVVVTIIAGEGKETQSKPAAAGDWVVRNRCESSGHEQYLVSAGKFAERYEGPLGPPDGEGWAPYRPRGVDMLYAFVRDQDGSFRFTAPWGEAMVARPGDALVRDPNDPKDLYRVQAAAFACTYEIVKPPRSAR